MRHRVGTAHHARGSIPGGAQATPFWTLKARWALASLAGCQLAGRVGHMLLATYSWPHTLGHTYSWPHTLGHIPLATSPLPHILFATSPCPPDSRPHATSPSTSS